MERVREELYLEEQEEANRQREIVSTLHFHLLYFNKNVSITHNQMPKNCSDLNIQDCKYHYYKNVPYRKKWRKKYVRG